MTAFPYKTPAAFRAALSDKLRARASRSPFTMTELQRQFAYDRLLARVFTGPDAQQWVLKGATALLARLDTARHSRDVDLAWHATAADVVEAQRALRGAVGADLGDFFAFELGPASALTVADGVRVPVAALLGGRPWVKFSVDMVTGQRMSAPPEALAPLLPLGIPGLRRVDYSAYPLVDHIGDKVSACHQPHARASGEMVVSTRYKDLVDLVLIARTQQVSAAALRAALTAQFVGRGIGLPSEFGVPGPLWPGGYEGVAASVPALGELRAFDAGLALVKRMLDPVLAGRASGRWEPEHGAWRGPK